MDVNEAKKYVLFHYLYSFYYVVRNGVFSFDNLSFGKFLLICGRKQKKWGLIVINWLFGEIKKKLKKKIFCYFLRCDFCSKTCWK